ncbi:MAG: hypothetical protein OXH22_08765 [Chloroflexi bacterium]|nr:hypothetical protein [Chloroflexota bacterium]
MIDSVVYEQMQRYLNREASVLEIRKWAFDNIPRRIEKDVDTATTNPSALSFLIWACCEYDLCRNHLGWSGDKAEAEFRDLLAEHFAERKVKASSRL